MAARVHVIQALLLTLLSSVSTRAMPPPPPIHCNNTHCELSNSYGVWGDRKPCRVSDVVFPETEEELRSTVARAVQKRGKVKVVSAFSHTIPKLACPVGNSVLISTEKYNSGIQIGTGDLTVTVDAGVSLRELIDKVEAAGLSLVAAPYWEGVSLGGLISTGAHGSSWWGKGGAVHDHVVGIDLIVPAGKSEGYAKAVRLDGRNPLFNAARVSLGLLGVISKVKLSLEPAFKRSITNSMKDDTNLENEFMDFARKHEFADITWYPSQQKAMYRSDDRVPLNTSGDGINDFLGFQSNLILTSATVRSSEKAAESTKSIMAKCAIAASVVAFKQFVANGLKNNNFLFTGYPVVGPQGKMQTSGSCLYSPAANTQVTCAWDPRIKGLFFYETTAIFPASKFKYFVEDVKKLRDLRSSDFCGVDMYNGFLIRFIKASDAYLGQSEDSVVLDFNYYRSDDASTPRLNEDVWEEVEQMAFFKYKARPHWAKNRDVAFNGVESKYPRFGKFIEARRVVDPEGVFGNEWFEKVVFGGEAMREDGCALEGNCVCSEDRHCSPGNGYFCKGGLVYNDARVCRYSPSLMG